MEMKTHCQKVASSSQISATALYAHDRDHSCIADNLLAAHPPGVHETHNCFHNFVTGASGVEDFDAAQFPSEDFCCHTFEQHAMKSMLKAGLPDGIFKALFIGRHAPLSRLS